VFEKKFFSFFNLPMYRCKKLGFLRKISPVNLGLVGSDMVAINQKPSKVTLQPIHILTSQKFPWEKYNWRGP
jgi:hypothetical protein